MNQPYFHIFPTTIPGCMEIQPVIRKDQRGSFTKVFQREAFEKMGLCSSFSEDFYSVSHQGVIRGLHFQSPPADHIKLVYCLEGTIQDAALDLRCGSPTFGQHTLIEISAEKGNTLYIPKGLAHGFCALSKIAIVAYKTSSSHSPEHDHGVLWSSAGIPWAETSPQVSKRDQGHPPLASFQSPFVYEHAE